MKNDMKKSRVIFLCSLCLVLVMVLNNVFVMGRDLVKNDITSSATTITHEELQRLPVGQSLSRALDLLPGVNPVGDQILIRGGSPNNTNYMVNGVPVNDPTHAGNLFNVPFNAVEEIQVQKGGTGAMFGGMGPGGTINIITKSGGNDFSGSGHFYLGADAFLYDLNQDIKDKYPTVVGNHDRSFYRYGLNLGGPIMADKLWFYMSGDITQRTAQTFYEDETPGDRKDFSTSLTLDYKPSLEDLIKFNVLYNNNQYEQKEDSYGYNYFDKSSTPQFVIGGSYNRNCDSGWRSGVHASYSRFDLDLGYGYTPTDPLYASLYRKDDNKRKTAKEFDTSVDILAPPFFCGDCRHELGMGFGYQSICYLKTYGSLHRDSHVYTEPDDQITETWENSTSFYHNSHMSNFSAYLMDTWTPFKDLKLNLGTRFDGQTFTWRGNTYNKQEIQEKHAYSWNNFSPRLSLVWDIYGDGSLVFDANAGRYYQSNQYGWFENVHPGGTHGYNRTIIQVNGTTTYDSSEVFSSPPLSMVGYDSYKLKAPYMDQFTLGIEKAISDDLALGLRFTKSYERNLIQTVDGSRVDMDALIKNNTLNWIDYQEVVVTNPANGQPMTVYQDLNPYRMPEYHLVNPPDADRSYTGIELSVNKRYSNGYAWNASYVYSHFGGTVSPTDYSEHYGQSTLYQNPNARINVDGLFNYSYPHQFKVNGWVDGPYDIRIGGSAKCLFCDPYARELSSAYPPLNTIQDGFDTIYAERRGDSRLPTFWMLNLGLEKTFKVTDTTTATLFVDGYNITNNAIKLKVNPIIGSPNEGEIERILNPGLFQFGVRVSF